MSSLVGPINDLDHSPFRSLRPRSQISSSGGGVSSPKTQRPVVCSVAPNLPARPPSSSDNDSIRKNHWDMDYEGVYFCVFVWLKWSWFRSDYSWTNKSARPIYQLVLGTISIFFNPDADTEGSLLCSLIIKNLQNRPKTSREIRQRCKITFRNTRTGLVRLTHGTYTKVWREEMNFQNKNNSTESPNHDSITTLQQETVPHYVCPPESTDK